MILISDVAAELDAAVQEVTSPIVPSSFSMLNATAAQGSDRQTGIDVVCQESPGESKGEESLVSI